MVTFIALNSNQGVTCKMYLDATNPAYIYQHKGLAKCFFKLLEATIRFFLSFGI